MASVAILMLPPRQRTLMKVKTRKQKFPLILALRSIVSHSFLPFIEHLAEKVPAEFNFRRGETWDCSLRSTGK